jgi:antitoxin (DNA-binding transcriptional repressor) of toxin-antitoxin stability system
MLRVNIAEAKANFSKLLRAAQAGEPVIICDRNREIVELRALPQPSKEKRPLGPARPGFSIPDSFFEPMSEEELREWEGGDL